MSHFSRELWGLEDWSLVHTWTVGRCIMCTRIRLLLIIYPFTSSFFFLSKFQHWIFGHFSRELCGLEDWNLVHTWTVGRCIMHTGIRLLLLISPFISSLFFLSNFQHWNFSSHFSPELWGLEDWKLVHTLTLGRYIMYTRIRLLLLIHLFVTLFSGTNRPRRLKLGTNVDSGLMNRLYRNQASAAYSSHYFFFFLSLQLSNIKNFHHIFLRNCEVCKIETWYTSG